MLNQLLFAFLIGSSLLPSAIYTQSFNVTSNRGIILTINRIERDSLLEEEEQLFIRSFTELYETLPRSIIKTDDLYTFLLEGFEEERSALREDQDVYFFNVVCDDKVVGFISFSPTDTKNEMYIRQFAIDPDYQKMGIGRALVFSIFYSLPKTNSLILATRHINYKALSFYAALGFSFTEEVPHGLNPEKYIGMHYEINN